MGRSKIHLKNIDMENNLDLYRTPISTLINQFRPSELMALLKLEPKTTTTCTLVMKLHLQFIKLEHYEYAVTTRDWLNEYCY